MAGSRASSPERLRLAATVGSSSRSSGGERERTGQDQVACRTPLVDSGGILPRSAVREHPVGVPAGHPGAPRMSGGGDFPMLSRSARSEEHTSELQSLMRISYAVICLKKTTITKLMKHT